MDRRTELVTAAWQRGMRPASPWGRLVAGIRQRARTWLIAIWIVSGTALFIWWLAAWVTPEFEHGLANRLQRDFFAIPRDQAAWWQFGSGPLHSTTCFALCCWLDLTRHLYRPAMPRWSVLMTATVLAVLDEGAQLFTTTRTCEWQALANDALGASVWIALLVAAWLVRLWFPRRSDHGI